MSKTWDHYHHASRGHERAAYHKDAGKYDEAEEHEKAVHHLSLARGHNQRAIHHDAEAVKLDAKHLDRLAFTTSMACWVRT